MKPSAPNHSALAPTYNRAQLARVDAELAEARLRRDKLDLEWGHAMYTAGCRRAPAKLGVALAQVVALIAELEESREVLMCEVARGCLGRAPR